MADFEIRVHGVSGTPPEYVLMQPAGEQVAGDDVAQFYRGSTQAADTKRSWLVEAFHWGRFTSGSPSRALWLVLIPFALLNLSRYMLLLPSRTKMSRAGKVADVVLRLFGLVLTLTLVTNVIYTSWDVVVHQCTSRQVCLQDNGWLSFLADWPLGARLLLGLAPLAAVIALLWWFGRHTFLHDPPGELKRWATETGDFGDQSFWYTSPKAPALRNVHVSAACAVAGILLAGALRTDFAVETGRLETVVSWCLIGLGGVLLVFALRILLAAPEIDAARRLPQPIQVFKWASLAYLVLSAGITICLLWTEKAQQEYSPLVGFETMTNVLAGLVMLLLLALLVVCLVLRWTAPGRALMDVDKPFRPLWRGFAGLAIAGFAAQLATAFSSGLAFRIADLLGKPVLKAPDAQAAEVCGCDEVQAEIVLSTSYWTGSLLWGVITIAFVVLLLPLVAALARQTSAMWWLGAGSLIAAATAAGQMLDVEKAYLWALVVAAVLIGLGIRRWITGWRADGLTGCVTKDYTGSASSDPAVGKTATMWRLALAKYRYHWVLGAICLLGGLLVAASGVIAALRVVISSWRAPAPEWLARMFSDGLRPVTDLGAWVVSGIIAALVVLGVRSWQGQKMRTAVGVVWDLIAFWPRLAHPLCPPPYGGRTVLRLADRANYLVHEEKASTVVLSGHSQGSLVCVAATCLLKSEQESAEQKETATFTRLRLLTYGSQLQWAFARLFPSYIGQKRIVEIRGDLKSRWHNLYRWTDPLGAPVLVAPTSGELPHPGTERWTPVGGDPIDSDFSGPALADRQVGQETRLRDPESLSDDDNVRAKSRLRGHSAYYADLEFNEVVASVIELPNG